MEELLVLGQHAKFDTGIRARPVLPLYERDGQQSPCPYLQFDASIREKK